MLFYVGLSTISILFWVIIIINHVILCLFEANTNLFDHGKYNHVIYVGVYPTLISF